MLKSLTLCCHKSWNLKDEEKSQLNVRLRYTDDGFELGLNIFYDTSNPIS